MNGNRVLCVLIVAVCGCRDSIRVKDTVELGATSWGAAVDGHWIFKGDRRDRVYRDFGSVQRIGRIKRRSGADAVLIFAQDRAPLGKRVAWTAKSDVVGFEALPYVRLPLALHAVHPLSWSDALFSTAPWAFDEDAPDEYTLGDDKLWDVVISNALFSNERMGILLVPQFHEIPPSSLAGAISSSDENNAKIVLKSQRVEAALNTYVLEKVAGSAISGMHYDGIDPGDGQVRHVVLLGPDGVAAILAHEIGHAFSLIHTDRCPGFESNNNAVNVMDADAGLNEECRRWFTEGQALRVHYNSMSLVHHPSLSSLALRPDVDPDIMSSVTYDRNHVSLGDTPPPCWRIWPDGESSPAADQQGDEPTCMHVRFEETYPSESHELKILLELWDCATASDGTSTGDVAGAEAHDRPMTAGRYLAFQCGRELKLLRIGLQLWTTLDADALLLAYVSTNPATARETTTKLFTAARGEVPPQLKAAYVVGSGKIANLGREWLATDAASATLTETQLDRAKAIASTKVETVMVHKTIRARRLRGIEGLGTIGSAQARAALHRLANDEDPRIRKAVQQALKSNR